MVSQIFKSMIAVSCLSTGAFASTIPAYPWLCLSNDQSIHFSFYSDDFGHYRRALSVEHQQFSGPITYTDAEITFAAYDTKLVFTNVAADYRRVDVALWQANALVRTFPMSCQENVLEPGQTTQQSFTPAWLAGLAAALTIDSLDEDSDRVKFNHVRTRQDFNIPMYAPILSQSISDIGDWFVVDVSAKQKDILISFLQSHNADALTYIKDDPEVKVLGVIFARDWYWGSGNIGLVLQKDSDLVTVVFPFEHDIKFGDEQLDHTY